ncbi:MAG: PIN domain-containing protein [Novosphingobium sp.]
MLLDSHYCFWLALRRDRLTPREFAMLIEPENDIAFASVAIWELRIKWERRFMSGTRKGEANPQEVLDYLRDLEMPGIALTPEIAAAPLTAPIAHSDPFDALLLTIAQETDRKLLTRDRMLRGHPLAFHAD